MKLPDLPIVDALPALLDALRETGKAVLQAPPGAGKTTVVPLALLDSGLVTGRIVMLEPRRLAVRAAAETMARSLRERPGKTVGYRMRGETRVSSATRIEVVTEAILTRMIQADPELPGIGAVIFDEFHERSLDADLGLALAIELKEVLRPDLALIVMSATLQSDPVATALGAPVITASGQMFPVEMHWLERPPAAGQPFEAAAARLVLQALAETEGGVLVFLPGEAEIRRVAGRLRGSIGDDVVIQPLYGALPFARQNAAIQPAAMGRKLVLSTAIAETSLTIQDIRVVVDCGLARRARFDPGTGMSGLVTERVTRAEAEQRRGRAGRVAPGWCYRMWTRPAEGGLAAYPRPEIETGDLTGLALELALWGEDPGQLAFVTQPPEAAMATARELLTDLGAVAADGRITGHGRDIAALPLHPRLAHMLVLGGSGAAGLAALLSERLPRMQSGSDLTACKALLAHDGPDHLRKQAHRLAELSGPDAGLSWAELAALAYPDRIAKRRPGDDARYILSGGRGAVMDNSDPLAASPLIVVTDIDGIGREGRIRRAIAISGPELHAVCADRIGWVDRCEWSRRDGRVLALRSRQLGAIVLEERPWKSAPKAALGRAALDGFRELGLGFNAAAQRLLDRVRFLHKSGVDMPDMSETALMDGMDAWLLPHLDPVPGTTAEIRSFNLLPALRAQLTWKQVAELDRLAPAGYLAPTGREIAIDYSSGEPGIQIRLQQLFGLTAHPEVAGHRLRITLLSPAGRPLQTTTDLPGFWTSSYHEVRKEMRGRYPKHPWPEDPTVAAPTTRAKPRGK